MRKISGLIGIISFAAALALTGCQTDGCNLNDTQSGSGNSDNTKSAKVRASDAYVVSLQSAATIKVGSQEFKTTSVEENGTVVFKGIPKDLNLSNATVYIPKDAIVDTDGDGVLSEKDQIIRMPLKAKGIEGVANPLATLALEHNDTEAYEKFKNFDPVKAKIDLIKNPDNDKVKALVAISDAVALLVKEAKGKDKNVTEIMQKIKLALVKDIAEKNETASDVQEAVIDTIDDAAQEAGVSEDNITKKVADVLKVIDTVHETIANEDSNITAHQAVAAVIAVSDADANANEVEKDIKEGMLNRIKEHIKENPIVKKHITEKGHFTGGNGFGFGMHGNGGNDKGDAKAGADENASAGGNLSNEQEHAGGMDKNSTHEESEHNSSDKMQGHTDGMDNNSTHEEAEHNSSDKMQEHAGGIDSNMTGKEESDHNKSGSSTKEKMDGMGKMDMNDEENQTRKDKKGDALNPKGSDNDEDEEKTKTDEDKDLTSAAKKEKDTNETSPDMPAKDGSSEGKAGGNLNSKADSEGKAEKDSSTDASAGAEEDGSSSQKGEAHSSTDINSDAEAENSTDAKEDSKSAKSGQANQSANSSSKGEASQSSTEAGKKDLEENDNNKTDSLAASKKQKMQPLTAPEA